MLEGCMPWPADQAARYRARGWWEGITIAEMLSRSAARHPEKTALVCAKQRLSYRDLVETSDRLACRFLDAGIKPLDRVVVQLPNGPAFVHTYFALTRIGAIPVTALRAHRHTEIRHFLRASGAVAYVIPDRIGDFDYRSMAAEVQSGIRSLHSVFVAGEPAAGQRDLREMFAAPMPADAVRAALSRLRPDASEVATMLLSGGTTSLSKLIPRTHDDYVLNARLCGRAAGFGADTVFMAILPLGHNYNLSSPGMLGTFYYGGTVVLAPSGDPAEVFSLVEGERVTTIAAVIPLISNWLNSPLPDGYDISSLKVIQNGGARLAPELRGRLRARFGCLPQEIYGTAEGLINMVPLDAPEEYLLHSSGMPVCEDDEIKVIDDAGNELPDGAQGELATRGPYTIHGYYHAPDKDAEAFTADGFYRMGDIVRKQGRYVYTEGRKKDLINRGGEKISCEEVENLIVAHPKVKAVTLVAMPDPVFGEKACAFVIAKDGQSVEFAELIAFLRQQKIASFKLPERLELVSEFPVSPVGKILKRQLREAIAAKMEGEKAGGAVA
ncbi:MAG: 2,3-dihydroxybenzoate-AMP ligase [Betaproteobacteria bacterium RIFCSPLOWO2_02_FULL_62_17]|nr:MAG: 2,3-dihydroxybenzoate-AMP ligase [Betaproteobacteria bacterium RIFCSPLOWO2_02_FULL_62_17]